MTEGKSTLPPGVAEVVLDNIVDWVMVVDHETHTWVYNNPACQRVTGYTPEELLGSNTFTSPIFPEESRAVVRHVLEQLHDQKYVSSIEYEIVHKDGRRVPVNVTVGTVAGGNGDVKYRVAIIRDMSIVQKLLDDLRKDIGSKNV